MFDSQLMAVKAASLSRLLRPAAALAGAGGIGAVIGSATAPAPELPPNSPPTPPEDSAVPAGDARTAGRKLLFSRLRAGLGNTLRRVTAPYTGAPQ